MRATYNVHVDRCLHLDEIGRVDSEAKLVEDVSKTLVANTRFATNCKQYLLYFYNIYRKFSLQDDGFVGGMGEGLRSETCKFCYKASWFITQDMHPCILCNSNRHEWMKRSAIASYFMYHYPSRYKPIAPVD